MYHSLHVCSLDTLKSQPLAPLEVTTQFDSDLPKVVSLYPICLYSPLVFVLLVFFIFYLFILVDLWFTI